MNETPYSEPYLVIARRYRPQKFDQVLGQDAAVATLKNAIKQHRLAQAYLFCGTRGTGKTTLARLLARAINCTQRGHSPEPCGECTSCREIISGSSLDVLEIDGASHRGIDDIRALTEGVPYAAAHGGTKVTIIDEVHMLTKEAFNALLKTLEEPPPNAKFIFATTEPHKIPATILSRCQRFDLGRIPTSLIMKKLDLIVRETQSLISREALFLIADRAEGSLRDAESLLDQVLSFAPEKNVDADMAAIALGLTPKKLWLELDAIIATQNLPRALALSQEVVHGGMNLVQALEQLLDHLRCHLIIQLGQTPEGMPDEWIAQYRKNSTLYSKEQLFLLLEEFVEAWSQARTMTPSVWWFEYLILRAARSTQRCSAETAVRKLIDLEQRLAAQPGPSSPQTAAPEAVPPTTSSWAAPIPPPQAPPIPMPPPAPPTIFNAPVEQVPTPMDSAPLLPPGRVETILRFASVELEGTLAFPNNS